MPSLLDAISNAGTAPDSALPAAAGATTDQSDAARRLLAARSGLSSAMDPSGAGGTPRASSLSEAGAAAAGGAQIRATEAEAAPAQEAQADKANQIADQRTSDTADSALRLAQIRQTAATRRAGLVQQYKQAASQIDDHSRTAITEQLAQDARLSSDRYATDLQYRGDVERLGSAARFRVAATEAAIGRDKDLLDTAIGNADWMSADNDTKKRALANLDLDIALAIAQREAEQKNTTAEYTGIGNAASGAAQAYANSGQKAPATGQ